MSEERAGSASVPPVVAVYVIAVSLAALGAVAASIGGAFRAPPGVAPIVGAVAMFALCALLHRFAFTFYWRDHRITVSLDELVVLTGLLVTPPHLLVLAFAASTAVMQAWNGPAQRIKRVFNVAQYTLAAAIIVAAHIALVMAGVPPLWSAALVAFAFGQVANFLLAGVFALITDVGVLRVYRERFLAQGSIAGVIGVSGGLMLVALWRLHPTAIVVALPFVYIVRRYWRLHAVADRELDVHRHLADATHDLVGTASVPAVAERVLGESERLLDCGRAEIVVETPEDRLSLARNFGSGPQGDDASISCELPAHSGGALGKLTVWPRQGKERFTEQERALLRTIAGQTASAMENARAIAAATAAQQRLGMYLSTAPDAVLLVDAAGAVQYMNPAAQRLLAPEGAAGCRASDFFDDERLAIGGGALPTEPMLLEASARSKAREGALLVEAHVAPLTENGRVSAVLMVVRDVTERKRLEEEAERQRAALAQSEKLSALGTLVAGVAHEINNPLTYMRGNLQLSAEMLGMRLAEANVAENERQLLQDTAECVKVAMEGVERITGITSSLKAVARKGSDQRRPEDLNRLVHDVLAVVKTGMPRSIRLELDLAEGLPEVTVKSSEIHQILLNLVKNAAEALEGRDDAWIRVRSYESPDAVLIEVADNGAGIPAEVQRSLFSPFFTTKTNGTGLGLSISRGIAQRHGGSLTLLSTQGEGTTFTLTLPKRAPSAESGV